VEDGVTRARLHREGEERFQRLRAQLGVSSFGLNLMRLRPGQRGRIHAHERQEEVYVVLAGLLTVLVGDGAREPEEHALGPDDALRVGPAVRRQLVNRTGEPVVLLAIGGAAPHEGRDGIAFPDWTAPAGVPPADAPLPPDLPVGAPADRAEE
jgi:uncharacterized cupin superfamily protein